MSPHNISFKPAVQCLLNPSLPYQENDLLGDDGTPRCVTPGVTASGHRNSINRCAIIVNRKENLYTYIGIIAKNIKKLNPRCISVGR